MPDGVQINIPSFAPPASTLASPYFWAPVGQGVQSGIQAAIERRRQRRLDELQRQMAEHQMRAEEERLGIARRQLELSRISQEHQMRTEEARLGISREQLELARRSQQLAEEQQRYMRESQYVDIGSVLGPQALQRAAQSGLIRIPEGYQPGQPLLVDQRIWQQLAPELTKTPQQRELERIQLTQAQLALQDLQSRFSSGLIPKAEAESWIETLPDSFRPLVRGMYQVGDDGREYLYLPAVQESLRGWLDTLGGAVNLQTGQANLQLLQNEISKLQTEWMTREQALDLLQKAGFDAARASAVITTDEQGRVNKQTLMDIANALNRWELEQLQAQGLRLQNLYEASTLDARVEIAQNLRQESRLKLQLMEVDLAAAREALDQLQGVDRTRKEREIELLEIQIAQERARLAIIEAEAEGGGIEQLLSDSNFMQAYDRAVRPYLEQGFIVPSPLEYAQYIVAVERGEAPASFAAFIGNYDQMARAQAGLDPRERNPLPWNQEGFFSRWKDRKTEFDQRFGGSVLATGMEAQRPAFPSPEFWWANEQAGKPLSDEELIEVYNMEGGEGIDYLRRKFAEYLAPYGVRIPGTVPFEDWYAALMSVEGMTPTLAYQLFLESTPLEQEKDALEVGMTVEELRAALKERAEQYEAELAARIQERRERSQMFQGVPDMTGAAIATWLRGPAAQPVPYVPPPGGPGAEPQDPRSLARIIGDVISEFLSRAFPSPQQSAQQLQSILPSMAAEGVAPIAEAGSALAEAIERRLAAKAGSGDQ